MTHAPTDWLVAPTLRLDKGEGLAEGLRFLREFDPRVFLIFGGDAEDVTWMKETLEDQAGHSLLFAADLERGAGQQFDGLTPLPDAWALGLLGPEACYDAGHRTAAEAAQAGVRWLLAPVLDLHMTDGVCSPIISNRAFGGDLQRVLECAGAWAKGAMDAGGIPCGKHFPGHGGCAQDSHVEHAISFDDPEPHLKPFRALAQKLPTIMVGHVEYPMLDEEMRPASRSPVMMDILRKDIGFDGVVISDSLNMSGFGDGPPEEMAVDCLNAGVDILLDPEDPVVLATTLRAAVERGDLDPERVAESTRRLEALIQSTDDLEVAAPRPLVLGASTKRLMRPLHGGSPGRKPPRPGIALDLASTPDAVSFLEEWGIPVLPADSSPPDPMPEAVLVLCGAREGRGLPNLPGKWLDALVHEHPVVYTAGGPEATDVAPASSKGLHIPGLSPALLALLFATEDEEAASEA